MTSWRAPSSMATPLLLLPGLLCDERIFAPQIRALGHAFDVVVADYREADSITEMARRALKGAPERFALAGHSMGARVALEVYRQAGERVERLALISTGVHPPRPGEAEKRHALLDLGQREGIDALLNAWLPPMVAPARRSDAAFLAPIYAMCRAGGVDLYQRQIAALLARPEVETLLSTIDCPVLVAVGDVDEWSPLDQHRLMAAAIPRATLTVLGGSGHMSPLEAPDALTAALRHWITGDDIPTTQLSSPGEADERS